MKKGLLFVCLLLTISFVVKAQDSALVEKSKAMQEALRGQKRILKSNPLPILWGPIILTNEYRLIYETPLALRQSAMIGVSYLAKGPFFDLIWFAADTTKSAHWAQLGQDAHMNGIRVQGMYRLYLTKKHLAPRGIYIGPQASYSTAKITWKAYPDVYVQYTNVNANIFIGAQGVIENVFVVDFFTGIGYKTNTYEFRTNGKTYTGNAIGISGRVEDLKLSLGFNLGYAF